MNIAKKTVLITGANCCIGRALVDEALRRGREAGLCGHARPVMAVADQRVRPLPLDVTGAAQIQRAAEAVDGLDVLINNAGIAVSYDLSDLDVIERHLAVNLPASST